MFEMLAAKDRSQRQVLADIIEASVAFLNLL